MSPVIPSVAYGHRPFSFLSYLVGKGHSVTLHCIDDPGPDPFALGRLQDLGIQVRPVRLSRMARWWNCMVGLPSNKPLRVHHCRSRRLLHQLLTDIKPSTYDVIHIDRFRMAPYAMEVRGRFEGPVVLDFPDALSLYYQRAVESPRNRLKARLDQRENHVIRDYEKEVLGNDLQFVVCSEIDRARLLESVPAAQVEVIPNMVDVNEFRPRAKLDEPPKGVFTGTLYYLPNIDGLLWLKEEVLPLLKDLAGFSVEVFGFGATSELDPVGEDPRFKFHGYVPNMSEHLFQNDVYLCPLRIGAGIRFKLLEAFAAGMATVSTTLGFEGIPCVPEEHLLVGDTPEEFAACIRRLLENPLERKRIGEAAREWVTAKYSVEAAGESLENLYIRLLSR